MNQDFEKKLGQRIRMHRMALGLSQEALAARLQVHGWDVTRSALAKIEVGQRHVYPDELRALHEILSVSYEQLLGDEHEQILNL